MTAGLIFFIVSAASALATLTAFAALLHGRPLHTLPRAARAILVLALLVLSVVSGRAWYGTTQHKPTEPSLSQRPASVVVTETPTLTAADTTVYKHSPSSMAKVPSTLATADGVAIPSPLTTAGPKPGPQNESPTARHDEIKVSEPGKELPDVLAARDDALNTLRSHRYTVRGHLRSTQGQADESLRGLITTDLTLDVMLIDTQGVVQDSFTISSRGGGFTRDSSALQARERLRDALLEHLQKEHP